MTSEPVFERYFLLVKASGMKLGNVRPECSISKKINIQMKTLHKLSVIFFNFSIELM